MAYTDINSEDRLVQATFAEHLELVQGPGGRPWFAHPPFRAPGRTGTRAPLPMSGETEV